ncbi:putative SP-containing protein [Vairimorpha necatrix]|uniref:SP-containing protein n=1 Tax=Vairimorpha necatrix TaxID=6039 RepID=A0AAX4JBU8_9MICR
MMFLSNFIVHFCSDTPLEKSDILFNNDIKTKEESKSINDGSKKYLHSEMDDIPLKKNQKIDLDFYYKVCRDYFAIITQHHEVKRKLDDLISNEKDIPQSFFFSQFSLSLFHYFHGRKPKENCLSVSSFLYSLAAHSLNLVFRLSGIKNFKEYINNREKIKYQILNSVDLKFDMSCENEISQLFNAHEYNEIFIMLNELNNDNHLRNRRNVPTFTTTRNLLVPDSVKKVYVGEPIQLTCRNGVCKPLKGISN